MTQPNLRYPEVTRRAFFGGMSLAAIAGVAACSSGSSTGTTTTTSEAGAASSAATDATASAGASSAAADGTTLPATASATVSWTFASASAQRNPYMAVWIEDAEGAFVKTLALYHKATDDHWLDTITRWYQVSGGTDTTTSGTVPAGSYTATWDGTTAEGDRAAAGSYYVCVESVVEHGDESLVREEVAFGDAAADTTLTPVGDITAAAVAYTV